MKDDRNLKEINISENWMAPDLGQQTEDMNWGRNTQAWGLQEAGAVGEEGS